MLLAAFVADAAARLLPVDPLTFRGWEALKRFRPPGAAFEPGRSYDNARAYGDLAALGNLRDLRQYRRERFSTDSLGFRNAGAPDLPPPALLLVGDSFTVGSGVSDEANLTGQLSRLLGSRVYNAGGVDLAPDRVLDLASRLRLRTGLVVYEYVEEYDLPPAASAFKRQYLRRLASLPPPWGEWIGLARGLFAVSPLKIACEHALKELRDDRVLPNSYASRVRQAFLVTGDPMLFLASAVEGFHASRPASADRWLWFQRELRRGGLDLLVVLAPGKYRVYRPFLQRPAPLGGGGGDYLERLEAELARAAVPVLNLTSALAAAAGRGLPRREYLYWQDDIHWNERGTEVAARAIAASLRRRGDAPDRAGEDGGAPRRSVSARRPEAAPPSRP